MPKSESRRQALDILSKTKIDTSRSGHGLRQCATDLSDRKENCSFEAPPEIVSKIVAAVREDQNQSAGKESAERTRLETRLTSIRSRMDAAYVDKLDGKIPEDFWQRKMSEWQTDEQQVRMKIHGLAAAETGDRAMDAQRVLELADKAHLLYMARSSAEKAKLLRMLCLNFSVEGESAMPAYRYPFDLIFNRAKLKEWSGREDLNLRPPGPEPGALPG